MLIHKIEISRNVEQLILSSHACSASAEDFPLLYISFHEFLIIKVLDVKINILPLLIFARLDLKYSTFDLLTGSQCDSILIDL